MSKIIIYMTICKEINFENFYECSIAKQLLDIENGKMATDKSTKCITWSTNFCYMTSTKDELIHKVILNIEHIYKNHQEFSELAI